MSSPRSHTPVATAPAPASTSAPAELERRGELKAPVLVVVGGQERELAMGSLLIGRDPSVDIQLMDPLVSRRHARLVIQQDGSLALQDLQSANGVFVNGTRVLRPTVALCDGDSFLLGTTEVSVFGMRRVGKVSNATPAESAPKPFTSESALQSDGVESTKRRRPVTTGRGAPIDMIGQFAEQLMGSGHSVDAIRALGEPLQNLLKGVGSGLTVDLAVLESAATYALRLHDWTKRVSWIEYIIELHLACRQVPTDSVLTMLEERCSEVAIDNTLVQFLIATLQGRRPEITVEESARLARVARLSRHDAPVAYSPRIPSKI